MKKRSYNQACSLATTLDLIGERWTWLILRGLLTGPKRYKDLLEQLPGVGTNLLAARVKNLVALGIAEKDGSGRQAAYQLTAIGEQLRPISHALINWGRNFPAQVAEGASSKPEWDMLAIEAMFRPERAEGISVVMEFNLSDFIFHLVIRNQQCRAISGATVSPDVRITSDSATLIAIGNRETTVQSAEEKIHLKIDGDRNAFKLLFELFE